MTEAQIQSACYKWYNNTYCLKTQSPRGVMWSVPNEAVMSMAGVMRKYRIPENIIKIVSVMVNSYFRSMGLKAGIADTTVILPTGKVLFVEFKTKTGRQSPEQMDFESTVTKLGMEYYVIRSIDDFQKMIYENIKRTPLI